MPGQQQAQALLLVACQLSFTRAIVLHVSPRSTGKAVVRSRPCFRSCCTTSTVHGRCLISFLPFDSWTAQVADNFVDIRRRHRIACSRRDGGHHLLVPPTPVQPQVAELPSRTCQKGLLYASVRELVYPSISCGIVRNLGAVDGAEQR